MKTILLCTLAAVAASQFASRPAEVILQRQGNRAILRMPKNFEFADTSFQGVRRSGVFDDQSSFQQAQRDSRQFQQAEVRSQQQQQQQQQQYQAQQSFQQSQDHFRSQQTQQRVPVQPATILAGAIAQGGVSVGAQVSSSSDFRANQQQEISQQQEFHQQQLQQQEFHQQQLQQQQQQAKFQQAQIQNQQQQQQSEVHGVFEPLNLPSGASLLLGQVSTEFSCNNLPYGYYGDEHNNCLVFHICYPALFSSGVVQTYQYSFMCGEGTQFDQKELACVSHETALPCAETQIHYDVNTKFGLPHEKSQ